MRIFGWFLAGTIALVLSASLALAQSAALRAGSKTATTTASTLGSGPCHEVLLQRDVDASGNGQIMVGDATSQPWMLSSTGLTLSLAVENLDVVYVKAIQTTGTQIVNWLCRRN